MPRAGWVQPQDDQRLSDHVALGVLTRTFPPELVDAVLRDTGREQRRRRLLPARLVVYYVLAMTLFSQAGYEEVMRSLVEGLSWGSGWQHRWSVPSKPAISLARTRLGVAPLAELFARGVVPLATAGTPGAFYRGRRLMSIDGTTLDLADTAGNVAEFGRPGTGRGEGSAFPQLRLVGLAESGTHAIVAAAMGACTVGEPTLARDLVGALRPGMLVLADRGFTAFPLWAAAAATGADLLWRAKNNAVLPCWNAMATGLSGPRSSPPRTNGPGPTCCPCGWSNTPSTTRAAPRPRTTATGCSPRSPTRTAAPAAELAALYPDRWEFETALDELKTHQRGPRVVLRSKTPDGVRQEAYGYLCTHYAIRALMHTAATDHGVDPDRVSFTASLHAARRSVRAGLGTATRTLAVALTHTIAEINRRLLPPRRLRANPRVVKRKMSNYNLKRAAHRAWPQPTRPPTHAVRVLAPP